MRFLCLHGIGTSSEVSDKSYEERLQNPVFEWQTAALRTELGDNHHFEFITGSHPFPLTPEMQGIFPIGEYWAFTDPNNPDTIIPFLAELEEYIESEGPFDALLGFSYGAALAGTFLMNQQQKDPLKLSFSFKCAIFICSLAPFKIVGDKVQQMSGRTDGESLSLPTAHIFGRKDDECYIGSLELMKLCNAKVREAFDHGGAHEIPRGARVTSEMAAVITKTIEKALIQQ